MRRPVDSPYTITTEFGVPDSNALFGRHSGVDYAKGTGSAVYAPKTGSIVYAQYHPTGGNMVILFDGQFYHRMMHNQRFAVSAGQRVSEGQVVSYSDNTGLSTGPHVHWDITRQQSPTSFASFVSPADWLNGAYESAAPPSSSLAGYQRRVGGNGVYRRRAATTQAEIIDEFPANDVLDFKGFIRGENYAGNNVWFVGRYTGGYCWSGAFQDTGTHDLEDLTPAAPAPTPTPTTPATGLQPYQRKVGGDVVNYREQPNTGSKIISQFKPGEVLDFQAFVHGQSVDGNDVWFKGKYSGGYIWSGGLEGGANTTGLTEVATSTPSIPVSDIPAPTPTVDPPITVVVNKKHPNSPLNYVPSTIVAVGNGQYLRKEAADAFVQMVADALKENTPITAGSGYRSFDTQTTVYNQYVKQDGQAKADTYSARPGFSEHQTGLAMDIIGGGAGIDDSFADTEQSKWLIANAHKYGFVLRYPKDKESVTGYVWESWHYRYVGVGVATDMKDKKVTTLEEYYKVEGGLYADQAETTPPSSETPPSNDDEEQNKRLSALEKIVQAIVDFLTGIFKNFKT